MPWFIADITVTARVKVEADEERYVHEAIVSVVESLLSDPEQGDAFGDQGVHIEGGINGAIRIEEIKTELRQTPPPQGEQ